jgi:Co/Zn/Cd efflux system component
MKDCLVVLMEGTPIDIEIETFKERLEEIEGVVSMHDLHIWSLGGGRVAMSAHIISKTPS